MTQHHEIQSANKTPSNPQDLPLQKFYDTELLQVPVKAGKLFEYYSKIPSDDILPHILQVVSRAISRNGSMLTPSRETVPGKR
jgi:hypothetical protein